MSLFRKSADRSEREREEQRLARERLRAQRAGDGGGEGDGDGEAGADGLPGFAGPAGEGVDAQDGGGAGSEPAGPAPAPNYDQGLAAGGDDPRGDDPRVDDPRGDDPRVADPRVDDPRVDDPHDDDAGVDDDEWLPEATTDEWFAPVAGAAAVVATGVLVGGAAAAGPGPGPGGGAAGGPVGASGFAARGRRREHAGGARGGGGASAGGDGGGGAADGPRGAGEPGAWGGAGQWARTARRPRVARRRQRRSSPHDDDSLADTDPGVEGEQNGEAPQWVDGNAVVHPADGGYPYVVGDDPFGVETAPTHPGLVGNPFAGELPEGLRRRQAPPRPPRARTKQPRTTGQTAARWAKRLAALAALVFCGAAAYFAISLFQPFAGSGKGTGRVVVVIPRGAGAREIGDILAANDVVRSGFLFDVRAAIEGKRGDLHSGKYTLAHGMSYAAAIAALEVPPPPPPVVHVLIPEGLARRNIATLARQDGLHGNYVQATRTSTLLSPHVYGAPKKTHSLEGFLFPATYDLAVGSNVSALIADQLDAFRQNFGQADVKAAKRLHVTPYGLLTIASMIEREAQLPRDRARVAQVIYRRLRLGIPLGIDATLRYALNDWDKPLTESQLALKTPYNTRLHKGLPPTPIGNPGLASITAAAHPAATHYLYYVTGADGCGDLRFARTFAGFQRLAVAYQDALRANGGRVPACKKKS